MGLLGGCDGERGTVQEMKIRPKGKKRSRGADASWPFDSQLDGDTQYYEI